MRLLPVRNMAMVTVIGAAFALSTSIACATTVVGLATSTLDFGGMAEFTVGPSNGPLKDGFTVAGSGHDPYSDLNYSYYAHAAAETRFVGFENTALFADSNVDIVNTGAAASADAIVNVYFTIVTRRPPPHHEVVPLLFEAFGSASVTGVRDGFTRVEGVGASADAHVYDNSGRTLLSTRIVEQNEPGVDTNLFKRDFYVDPIDPFFGVELNAEAGMGADCVFECHYNFSAHAFVDPSIEFDQELFDEIYGPESFKLTDYYALEFSPNLFVSTPEPSSFGLLASALFGLWVLGRRRHGPFSRLPRR